MRLMLSSSQPLATKAKPLATKAKEDQG